MLAGRIESRHTLVANMSAAAASSPASSAASPAASSDGWFARSISHASGSPVRGDPSLRLASLPHSGRGVLLGNGCAAGAELLAEQAGVARSLLGAEIPRRCAHCWTMLAGAEPAAPTVEASAASSSTAVAAASPVSVLHKCSGCGVHRYCNRACQAAHWARAHRLECACWTPYKSRPSSTHPAYMPTVSLVVSLALWSLQRPLRALAASQVDPAIKDSPTWLSQEKARLAAQAAKDGDSLERFDEWISRFERNVDNLQQHSAERKREYFEMSALVREVTLHACPTDAQKSLHSSLLSISWFQTVFARINCNAFSVCDAELKPVGSALFPTVSMINHSCTPNAVAMFSFGGEGGGGGLSVRICSIARIAPGEQLTLSYIGLAQPASARLRTLREQYFFDCHCTLCDASAESNRDADDPRTRERWLDNKKRDAFKCHHAWKDMPGNAVAADADDGDATAAAASSAASSAVAASASPASPASSSSAAPSSHSKSGPCNGILLSNASSPSAPRCSHCGRLHNLAFLSSMVSTHVLPLVAAANAGLKSLETLKSGAKKGEMQVTVRQQLQKSLHALHMAYAPPAVPLLTVLDDLLRVCIESGEWELAHRTVSSSLEFYDALYSVHAPNHPLLALQLLTHAKLAWLLCKPTEALRSWKRALPILRITHGDTHALVRQVQEAIPPAEMEAMQEAATSRRIKA